jgi:hypothetical protein
MMNAYKNLDFIVLMFPILFPYGLGAPKMLFQNVKISLKAHVKYLMTLNDENHGFSKHYDGYPKNIIPISPISQNFIYKYDVDGVEI